MFGRAKKPVVVDIATLQLNLNSAQLQQDAALADLQKLKKTKTSPQHLKAALVRYNRHAHTANGIQAAIDTIEDQQALDLVLGAHQAASAIVGSSMTVIDDAMLGHEDIKDTQREHFAAMAHVEIESSDYLAQIDALCPDVDLVETPVVQINMPSVPNHMPARKRVVAGVRTPI
jgi:hypothetical protein